MRCIVALILVLFMPSFDQYIKPLYLRCLFSLALAWMMPVTIVTLASLETVMLAKPVALIVFHTCL